MIREPHWRRRAAILFGAGVAACATGENEVPTGPDPIPSITISLDPTHATVAQGASVAITATLTSAGGYKGIGAAFAMTGPLGVTFSVDRLETSGSITTATITAAVAGTTSPGNYTIVVTGSGTGVSAVWATLELTVPRPSIAIRINPTSATVGQGGTVAVGAALTGSIGFTGTGAAFALTGAPTGVTSEVSYLTRGSITTATITISADPAVPLGTYALVLTGSGAGVDPVSTPLALTVVGLGFTLSVNPATLDLCEGCGDVTATITISRVSGFTGQVVLSVSSSAVGSGGTFTMGLDPTSPAGNRSILTVSTNAPPGSYTLTITGTAPGFATQTATIAVTVW